MSTKNVAFNTYRKYKIRNIISLIVLKTHTNFMVKDKDSKVAQKSLPEIVLA